MQGRCPSGKEQRTTGQRGRTQSYGMHLQSKPNKMGYGQRMHENWKIEMETIKKKIEGQNTKDTEVAPVVQIVTEEEYIELFGTESEIELESTEETPET